MHNNKTSKKYYCKLKKLVLLVSNVTILKKYFIDLVKQVENGKCKLSSKNILSNNIDAQFM